MLPGHGSGAIGLHAPCHPGLHQIKHETTAAFALSQRQSSVLGEERHYRATAHRTPWNASKDRFGEFSNILDTDKLQPIAISLRQDLSEADTKRAPRSGMPE